VARSKKSTDTVKSEPNWALWASKDYWTLDEAAALVDGLDPDTVHQQSDEILQHYGKMKHLIDIAQRKQMLTKPMRPLQVVEFFLQLGEMGVPPSLRKAVVEFTNDPVRSFSLLAKRCEELEKQNKALKRELDGVNPLDPRERKTLLVLLCGLVHTRYRYDPEKKSDVVKTIKSTLAHIGLKLSDDIIREWLKKAFEYLPHDQFDALGRVKNNASKQ
jgi:hypothetical protein